MDAESDEDDEFAFSMNQNRRNRKDRDRDSLEEVSSEELSDDDEEARVKAAAEKLLDKRLKEARTKNRGRVGSVPPNPTKMPNKGYDPEVEQASIPELKNMLQKLKRQDGSIFSTQTITNPMKSSLWTMGTGMFRRVFCGFRPGNAYCIRDSFGPQNFFDGFKKMIRSLKS
jgi:hypothetical protein